MTSRLILGLALLSLAACPPKDSTDESSGSSGDPSGTTDAPTTGGSDEIAACACHDDAAFFDTWICEIGPCGEVAVDCDVEMDGTSTECPEDHGKFTVDEQALDCSLDRLIAGAEGWVGYEIDSNGPGRGGGFAVVLPGRQAVVRAWTFYDLSGTDTNVGVVPLKSAAYFQGCKDMADVEQRFACFRQWSDAEPADDCDAASEYEDFL